MTQYQREYHHDGTKWVETRKRTVKYLKTKKEYKVTGAWKR